MKNIGFLHNMMPPPYCVTRPQWVNEFSGYWHQAISAPTSSVCYYLVVICSVCFRFVCCKNNCPLMIIFGYICQYIRWMTNWAMHFVRGFWHFRLQFVLVYRYPRDIKCRVKCFFGVIIICLSPWLISINVDLDENFAAERYQVDINSVGLIC